MRCLKTGLYFHTDNKVYHCDMHGVEFLKTIVLRGFAPEPTDYTGGYHVTWDKEKDAIVPTEKFVQFMKDWNDDYEGWETWKWRIDDTWCRFSDRIHTPKV